MDFACKESIPKKEEDEDARVQIWKYIFGFAEMAIVKCAIELKIADTIESHGSPMSLSQLSFALNCCPPLLYRILRFLVHRGIFKEELTTKNIRVYTQTPLSRLLARSGDNSMAPFLLFESNPVMLAPWHNLSACIKANELGAPPFEATHGKDLWSYAAADPMHNTLLNDAMACSARVITVPALLEGCGEIFEGVGSLVDVGGGNGTSLSMIVKACPWIQGINFDLPHVISVSPECMGVQHVGGNMFHYIPKADAAFFLWVLHDWDDEDCIKILKNCKDAIPKKTGKVIIVEAVINEKEENNLSDVGLMLDMVMMAHTNKGKERTREEWAYVLHEAGFKRYTITPIPAVHSVIQGVGSLVDVGGGNGTNLSIIVKACPGIRGINFDLPHVISMSPKYKDVQHVGGDMFDCIPKADVAFLMWVLHDWSDEECVKILKNCKDAIPKKTGKVIIVEAVIEEKKENNLSDVGLMLDMAMMAHTNKGKERTQEEWAYVLHQAGFNQYTITPIQAVQSVIQGFL